MDAATATVAVPGLPQEIAQACQALGWTPIRVQRGYGRVAYLVEANGIVEPYTREAILQAALCQTFQEQPQ